MKMKKLTLNLLALTMIFSLTACKSTRADDSDYIEENPSAVTDNRNAVSNGDITFSTRDADAEAKYQELVRIYEAETGVKINFTSIDNDISDDEYFNSFENDEMPTIFELRGYSDYNALKNYTKDLTNFDLYSKLDENVKTIQDNTNMGVYGIPHSIEGHGILYNKSIVDKYFALDSSIYNSIDEITDYSSFSALVEDMTKYKDELQIDGVFSATSLKEGEDDRFYKNLANIPIYHEIKKSQVDINGYYEEDINLSYHDNFNNIYDLYLNNSTTDRDMLYTVSQEDAMTEFALGKSVMVQGSNSSYRYIDAVEGRILQNSDIKMLPIYTGISGEENYSISVGSDRYLAINKNATDEQQLIAEDFLTWLHTSSTGKDYVSNQLGYYTPFTTYSEDERVDDPISTQVREYQSDTSKATIPFYYGHLKDDSYADRLRDDMQDLGDSMRNVDDKINNDTHSLGEDMKDDFSNMDNDFHDNITDQTAPLLD